MTSALQVFSYEDSQIRTYTDENGEVWLVAKDVCDFLEIANARDAVSSLDDDEKADVAISDGSQRRHYNVINEAGLYKLTFRSRKPEAKKFTRWVTHEVLPQIRKTGSYIAPEVEESEEVLEPLNIRSQTRLFETTSTASRTSMRPVRLCQTQSRSRKLLPSNTIHATGQRSR